MHMVGVSAINDLFITKLFYLVSKTHIHAGMVVQCYHDKVFVDKVDSTHHATKGDVVYLVNTVLKHEAIGKTIYISSKPSQYLFTNTSRPMKTDGQLIQWWLRCLAVIGTTGQYYIPLETEPQWRTTLQFEPFDRYDFKADGIDDPSQSWDTMTAYIGCFKVRLQMPLSQQSNDGSRDIVEDNASPLTWTIVSTTVSRLQAIIREARITHTPANLPVIHSTSDIDTFKTSLCPKKECKSIRLDALVKRRKVKHSPYLSHFHINRILHAPWCQ